MKFLLAIPSISFFGWIINMIFVLDFKSLIFLLTQFYNDKNLNKSFVLVLQVEEFFQFQPPKNVG
tara:strand:- start:465 stop:659 length:195 start_codon:yes stop_codon:yes gene_type:complete